MGGVVCSNRGSNPGPKPRASLYQTVTLAIRYFCECDAYGLTE